MYKMIVSDFDGTIVDRDGRIPISTVIKIDELRRSGILFVIATGRCLNSISYYNKDFNFIDYVVSCNGAYVYDLQKQKCIFKKNILITNVRKIVNKYIDDATIYAVDGNIWHLLNKESVYKDSFDTVIEDDYNYFLNNNKNNIYKLELYFKNKASATKAIKEITNMDLKVAVNIQENEGKYIVEITHKEVNKLEGVKKVLLKRKISLRNVISFGDGENDACLLKASGMGVAPENAIPKIKKLANDLTLDCNHKGVEKYLVKIISEFK